MTTMPDLNLPHGVIGMQLEQPDTSRPVVIRDGNENSPENLAAARMQFPEADRDDFTKVGKRKWKDEASGTVYREFSGACLLSLGSATVGVVGFFQDGGRLVFLQRLDMPEGVSIGMTGPLRSGVVEPDGRIRWQGAA
jgi:hypothetical protein